MGEGGSWRSHVFMRACMCVCEMALPSDGHIFNSHCLSTCKYSGLGCENAKVTHIHIPPSRSFQSHRGSNIMYICIMIMQGRNGGYCEGSTVNILRKGRVCFLAAESFELGLE